MTKHEKFDGGTIVEVPGVTEAPKPKRTRAQRVATWREQNRAAIQKAHNSCCVCSPTRAEVLLYEQSEDPDLIPDNELPE